MNTIMEYKTLSNGLKLPSIGLGTWGIGGRFEKDTSNEKDEIILIKKAIECGLTHIDTGEIYGEGQTERLIGKAIKDFDRSELFITTKVWKTNLHYDHVIRAAESSIKRLDTSYIDLYLIHYPNPEVPIKETMEAMESLVEQEKIKAIGVSNFSISQIEEAQKYLKTNRIVANQIEYNLLNREPEKEMIPYSTKSNMMIIAYRPFARGNLVRENIPKLELLAKKYNKTRTQIILNWLISHKNVITIPKPGNIEHIIENSGAVGWKLNDDDKRLLEDLF